MYSIFKNITNGSFDPFQGPASHLGNIGQDQATSQVTGWVSGNLGSPDFFTENATNGEVGVPINKFGEINALDGISYVGFFNSQVLPSKEREYLLQELSHPLQPGRYYAEFHVARGANSSYALGNIGMHILENNPFQPNTGPIEFTGGPKIGYDGAPLVNTSWTKISGIFNATGKEKFVIIGNFSPEVSNKVAFTEETDNIGAYYYVDKVNLHKMPEVAFSAITLESGTNVTFFVDEPLFFSEFVTYEWTSDQDSQFSHSGLTLTVSPTNTIGYTLTVTIANPGSLPVSHSSTVTVTVVSSAGPYGCSVVNPFRLKDKRTSVFNSNINFEVLYQESNSSVAATSHEWFLNGNLVKDSLAAEMTGVVQSGIQKIGLRVLTNGSWSGVYSYDFISFERMFAPSTDGVNQLGVLVSQVNCSPDQTYAEVIITLQNANSIQDGPGYEYEFYWVFPNGEAFQILRAPANPDRKFRFLTDVGGTRLYVREFQYQTQTSRYSDAVLNISCV